MNERQPPHDPVAERSVLGACLRDATVIDDVRTRLKASDFYHHANQTVFTAIHQIAERTGVQAVDLVTLSQALKDQIKDLGGYGYLANILESCPTAANAIHYAEIVKNCSIRRQLIYIAGDITREAYNPVDPDTVLDQAEKWILGIRESKHTELKTLQKCAGDVIERTGQVAKGEKIGIQTGILDLDEIVIVKPEDLVIIAARPSVGKSMIGTQIAVHIALQQEKAVFFASVEMPGIDIASRVLSMIGSVDSAVTAGRRMPTRDEAVALMEAQRIIHPTTFLIDDSPQQTMPIIAANARRLARQHALGLIVVDYLQLIQVERQKGQTRAEALGEVSRGLKRLCRELQVPIIALAQLNREGVGEPELHHIRESGDIESDADQVWLPWRDEEANNNTIYIKIAKQRGGPTGSIKTFHRKEFMRLDHHAAGIQSHQPTLGVFS